MRCQVILLKSTERKSEEVAKITGMTYLSVNAWVKRYKDFGIEGLINDLVKGVSRFLIKRLIKNQYYKVSKLTVSESKQPKLTGKKNLANPLVLAL